MPTLTSTIRTVVVFVDRVRHTTRHAGIARRHTGHRVQRFAVDTQRRFVARGGMLKWLLTLGPKAKRIIRFDGTSEYPTNLLVTGLP